MPKTESTLSVRIELDGIVGLAELEQAAMAFAREAPAQLVADAIESMIADLVDAVVGPFGMPLADEEQLDAPWCCTECGSRRGFRRRGFRPKPRKVTTACGKVSFRSQSWPAGAVTAGSPPRPGCSACVPTSAAPSASASWRRRWRWRWPTPRRRGCWGASPARRCRPAASAVT